jgi:hypothetical protein
MPWMKILGGLGGAVSSFANMRGQARENRAAAERENLQRRQEFDLNQRRAARLEDIAGLFHDQRDRRPEGMDQMGQMAAQLSMAGGGPDSSRTLERAAMQGLQRQSGMLDAGLAARGIYSSGAALGQQRALASDTMMGLSRDIAADRRQGQQLQMQGQQGAANIFGQMGQLDQQNQLAMLQGIAQLMSDPSMGYVGANADDFAFNPEDPSAWEYILGALGGGFGGAANIWAADPDRRRTTQAGDPNRNQGHDPRFGVRLPG